MYHCNGWILWKINILWTLIYDIEVPKLIQFSFGVLQWINYIMINIYLRRTFKANYKRHKLKHKNESRTIKLLINKIEWDCDKKIPKRHKHTYIVSYIQNIKKGIWLAYYCESDRFYNKLKKMKKTKGKF